jgi:hypothetical protein
MPKSKKFRALLEATKKQYTGKPVPVKYRKKYGKIYSEKETKQIAYAIGNKLNWRI